LGKLRYPFQWETLDRLGITTRNLLQIDGENFFLKAKNLVVISLQKNLGGCPKWACNFLRNTFLKETNKPKGFERIYISREDASHRKVKNEEEILNLLCTKGFKKIVLSGVSFQEQIHIFSSAKFIVSPNGAGLTNLVFCTPGTRVVELFARTANIFMRIGSFVGLDHYYLKCGEDDRNNRKTFYKDIIVNPKELVQVLRKIGI